VKPFIYVVLTLMQPGKTSGCWTVALSWQLGQRIESPTRKSLDYRSKK